MMTAICILLTIFIAGCCCPAIAGPNIVDYDNEDNNESFKFLAPKGYGKFLGAGDVDNIFVQRDQQEVDDELNDIASGRTDGWWYGMYRKPPRQF